MTITEKLLKLIKGNETEGFREVRAAHKYLDDENRQLIDGRQMAPPIGHVPTPPIQQTIAEMIARASIEAERQGFDTEEENNDFLVLDDEEPNTSYETDGMSDDEVMEEAYRRGLIQLSTDQSSMVPVDSNSSQTSTRGAPSSAQSTSTTKKGGKAAPPTADEAEET